MFIGRTNELKVLEDTYIMTGFQMTVVYGRRRIGKSCLISEFIKDKRASYYVARQSSLEDNIKKWSVQFIEDLYPDMRGVSFHEPEGFFEFVAKQCREERVVLALDEIPYIAEADESFLSRLQAAIDRLFIKSNIYLIICGSAISFMENEILSEKSPVFGRRTNQIFLKPFDYKESAAFVPDYSYEDKAIVYGVTGGVAKYLTLFDGGLSLDQNLVNNYFSPSGYLYEEAHNLLTQEFRSINTYNSVIELCAGGANKFNEIADKAHISTAALSYTLKGLESIGVITKVTAMTQKESSRKSLYEVCDSMYRFWYSFIPAARAAIELNRGEAYYKNNVKPALHEYMGKVFEEMCRYYTLLQGLEGKLNCFVTNVGSWWGPGHDHKQTDIDVVGIDTAAAKAVLGECKFQNRTMDQDVYEKLMSRRGLIDRKYSEVQYLFFSLAGFSEGLKNSIDVDTAKLIDMEELYK